MARVDYRELVAWLKQHPKYKEFEKGVDAEIALYISFGKPRELPVESETFDLLDGSTLVVDHEKDGTVVGLEIV